MFALPTSRAMSQGWNADFDDWDGDGDVDYPGGFYATIGWRGHNGYDFACHIGDPVYAAADGVVSWAGPAGGHWLLSGGGNAVLIGHPAYGVQTEYLHLSRSAVRAGDTVSRGQLIAYSGDTGASTAPHLHFGVLPLAGVNVRNGYRGRIDPGPYYAGGLSAHGTYNTTTTEEIVPNHNDRVFWPIEGEGQVTLNELLNSLDRKASASLAAINGLLGVQLPDPTDPGKTYSVADWIVWSATNAKLSAGSAAAAAGNTSPEALSEAIGAAALASSAADVASRLGIVVLDGPRG